MVVSHICKSPLLWTLMEPFIFLSAKSLNGFLCFSEFFWKAKEHVSIIKSLEKPVNFAVSALDTRQNGSADINSPLSFSDRVDLQLHPEGQVSFNWMMRFFFCFVLTLFLHDWIFIQHVVISDLSKIHLFQIIIQNSGGHKMSL